MAQSTNQKREKGFIRKTTESILSAILSRIIVALVMIYIMGTAFILLKKDRAIITKHGVKVWVENQLLISLKQSWRWPLKFWDPSLVENDPNLRKVDWPFLSSEDASKLLGALESQVKGDTEQAKMLRSVIQSLRDLGLNESQSSSLSESRKLVEKLREIDPDIADKLKAKLDEKSGP